MKKIIYCLVIVLLLFITSIFIPSNIVKADGYKIELDDTYLYEAAVSEEIIKLSATVYDNSYNKVDKKVVYSISSGADLVELNGDELIIKKPGIFKVRASLKEDESIYDEIETYADFLELQNVEFLNDTDLTVYTQHFELKMGFESNITNDSYNSFEFEVVSGPGKIFGGNRLKVTGEGIIVVKATAIYDSNGLEKTIEFNVTDPDKVEENTGGCRGNIQTLILLPSLLSISLFILKKKENY